MILAAWNATRAYGLGDRIAAAVSSRDRRAGLLDRIAMNSGSGLWIAPCEAIHTFGMRFPIDVVFLSRDGHVLKVINSLTRRRIAVCWRADSVLELPSGTVLASGTVPGDLIEVRRKD